MEAFLAYLHTHQFAVIAVITIALIILYFLLKNLIKLAMLFLLILIIVGSYFYLTAPKRSPDDIMKALKQAQDKTEMVVEKGKGAYQKGKEVVEKGKQLSDDIGKVLNKDKDKE
ncbi:MAG: hypothetical protein PHN75_02375 [Syntrophales bacterium]|nr:hypothetical protein [Syntrophales bacterium]